MGQGRGESEYIQVVGHLQTILFSEVPDLISDLPIILHSENYINRLVTNLLIGRTPATYCRV